jgi:hypothetical protein
MASLGFASRFVQDRDGGEIACSILGVIVVLVAGTIWRRRRLSQIERPAGLAAGETPQPADRKSLRPMNHAGDGTS